MNQGQRVFDHGQRFQPQEIHFQQAKIVERSHGILADHVVAFDVVTKRDVIRQIAICDHHACSVHARVARQTFEDFGMIEKLTGCGFSGDRSFQFRILFNGCIERDVQLIWNHLCYAIGVAIAPPHHSPDVPHHAFRLEFAKSNDLCDAAFAILLPNIFENFAAARFAKIDIDIWRRNAVRIQKSLEDQAELQRIDIRNSENVGDHRACSRAAPGPHRNAPLLREMDEVPNDEQITDESSLLQNAQLIIEPPEQLRIARGTFTVALPQAAITKLAQITFARFAGRNRILRVF